MAEDNGLRKTSTIPGNERKCPNCGGTLTYDPSSGKLYCSLCQKYETISRGTHDDVKVKGIAYKDILNSNRGIPRDKCKLLSCDNCGAELIYTSVQVSGTCPFCGSTNIVPAARTGSIMSPNGIIPFSIDENKAKASFHNHLKSSLSLFTPDTEHYALENLAPVYLPCFSFDSDAVSDYLIEIGYRDSDGNIHYKTRGGTYKGSFSGITVFASSKTQNSQINRITEFHPSSVLPFHPDYLAGYYAERCSMTLNHAYEIAQQNITEKLNTAIPEHALREFKGVKYKNLFFEPEYSNTHYKYILAPFYLASYTHKDEKYDVAINGVTGEVASDIPFTRQDFGEVEFEITYSSQKIKYMLIYLGIAAVLMLICFLINK